MIEIKKYLLILMGLTTFWGIAKESPRAQVTYTIQSKSAKANDTIHYGFEIKNENQVAEIFHLKINDPRTLACQYMLSDSIVTLKPQESYSGKLQVIISDRMPKGGKESCFITIENELGNRVETFEFISVRAKEHPFLLVTNDIINETKEKVKNYPWAKANLDAMLKELDVYKVPERKIVTKPRPVKVWSSFNYRPNDSEEVFRLCLAWKLTGKESYKEKAIRFIKEVCDKDEGYLSIGAATYGVQVHEGNFFLHLAAACDILFNEPEFSAEDRENIEATFRYYLELNRKHMDPLGIMNHQASANAGAILSALFLQDVAEVEYLTEADGGMADQIGKGVMDDGWWFEGTANYCYLVVQRYSLVAQAFQNYGWDLYHRRFPVKFKSKDFENVREGFTGMKFDNWGPVTKNTIGLEDMVTPYIPFMDENANVVATNDSNLKTPDPFYELAYRAYKLNDLAWVLSKTKRDSWVSLMYGVPELPEVGDPRTASAFAPNVGLVALRSHANNNTPEEQIQAYFKYGTHGGWHGHFDRTNMIGLDRNGHKYFGAEMVWFGYGNPGYKECVQTSATHNMVIVDGLQQEAVPSKQTLFYKGEMMQATVVETKARWRKIPTWNAEKFPPWDDTDYDGDFEPILQRRLSIVTDDYVVIADYITSNKKHNYDWLVHPVGFQTIKGVKKKGRLLDTLSHKKDSPYKYFANAQWYNLNKGAIVEFDEEGNKLDVITLWPKKASALIADYPIGGKQRTMRNNPDRKTYGVRVNAKETEFLHVLEPYKGESAISKIEAKNSNEFVVYLKDGREHHITLGNLKEGDVTVHLYEVVKDKIVRTETTK
ncbi:heparinase II/III family protein [Maribacter sp. TH_r10]|uniref:alginate lyase family protein n=1 Tax=Maribacter sp. TH_r10 TaxID=3082086 RepID=UPI0029553252|nr:heparinase II/III family protein [Maribacter sp. TH_r10]MDV7139140.1 heparinase II/III family protein [Maribacter sp. TH_r10]